MNEVINQAKKTYKENLSEYALQGIERQKEITAEINALELGTACTVYKQERHNAENIHTALLFNTKVFEITKDFNGYYVVREREAWTKHKYISTGTRADIYAKHNEGVQKMKKPNANRLKKILKAIIYAEQELDEKDKEILKRYHAHTEQMEALGIEVKTTDEHRPELKNGRTDINGIEYSYHYEQDGYISEKIELSTWRYDMPKLALFMKLKDNGLQEVKPKHTF